MPESGNMEMNSAATAHRRALRVTVLSIVFNTLMSLAKVVVGHLGNSRALIADGIHSLLDLSSDFAVIIGLHVARLPKDRNHPYGHHRFVTFIQLAIALSIVVFAGMISFTSLLSLRDPGVRSISGWAIVVAALSILGKEGLFWITRAVALDLKSRLLLTNAWHHRTDSMTSVITMAAVATPFLLGDEWRFLDALAGAALGLYLAWAAIGLCRPALNDLLDRAPDQRILNDIREHILPVEGVVAYHEFRARRIGDMLEVDLHLQVPAHYTVEQGHEIARQVRNTIMTTHPEVFDVLIHIEPATAEHIKNQGLADGPLP